MSLLRPGRDNAVGVQELLTILFLKAKSLFSCQVRRCVPAFIEAIKHLFDKWRLDMQLTSIRRRERTLTPSLIVQSTVRPEFQSNGKAVDLFDYHSLNRVAGLSS